MEDEVPTSGRELKSCETIPLSQDFNGKIHNIDTEEMNYYSSFIIPTFTLILIITCLVVAFLSEQDFEDSLNPSYLVAAAAIMGLDLLMMIIKSAINKFSNKNNDIQPSENSSRNKKIPKIMPIILFLGYFSLIIIGSLTFTVLDDSEITSKDNTSLSVTCFAVYCFILVRAMIEILSFIILWLLNAAVKSNDKSKKDENGANEINTYNETSLKQTYNIASQFMSSQGDDDKTPTLENTDNKNKDETKTSFLPNIFDTVYKGNFDDPLGEEERKEPSVENEDLIPRKQNNISLENKAHTKKRKKVVKHKKVSNPKKGEISHAKQKDPSFKYTQPAEEQHLPNQTVFFAYPENDLSSINPNNFSF